MGTSLQPSNRNLNQLNLEQFTVKLVADKSIRIVDKDSLWIYSNSHAAPFPEGSGVCLLCQWTLEITCSTIQMRIRHCGTLEITSSTIQMRIRHSGTLEITCSTIQMRIRHCGTLEITSSTIQMIIWHCGKLASRWELPPPLVAWYTVVIYMCYLSDIEGFQFNC